MYRWSITRAFPFLLSRLFISRFFFFLTWNCRVGRIEWKSGTWYGGWGIHCFLTGVLHCLFWVRIIGLFERDLCIIVRQESNEKLVKSKKYEISIRKIVNFFSKNSIECLYRSCNYLKNFSKLYCFNLFNCLITFYWISNSDWKYGLFIF